MAGDKEKSLHAGMNDHVTKPIDPEQLFAALQKWITPAHSLEPVKKTTREQLVIPDLDGINTVDGLARVQGNSTLYLKLLRMTAESQLNFSSEFNEAVENGDWELATRLTHTLKGVAGNIGAESLQTACAALEHLAGQQQTGDAQFKVVDVELQRVLKSVSSLAELSIDKKEIIKAVPDRDEVDLVLAILAEQIADYDTSALETIESNYELFEAGFFKSQLPLLEKALGEYDFDTAQALLKKMNRLAIEEAQPPVDVDGSRMTAILKELSTAIAEADTVALDMLEAEETMFISAGFTSEFKQIEESLNVYDFDSALAIVGEVAQKQNIKI
jgi:two-component system sensor histidine kinase/response regulator